MSGTPINQSKMPAMVASPYLKTASGVGTIAWAASFPHCVLFSLVLAHAPNKQERGKDMVRSPSIAVPEVEEVVSSE
jgi:hypothetical protein